MGHGPFKNSEARALHWYTGLRPEICNRLDQFEDPKERIEVLKLVRAAVFDTGGVTAWEDISEEWKLELLAAFTSPELEQTLFYRSKSK